jgi:hypothetical protein
MGLMAALDIVGEFKNEPHPERESLELQARKANSPTISLWSSTRQVKRIQIVVIRADIDKTIGYRRRGDDITCGGS